MENKIKFHKFWEPDAPLRRFIPGKFMATSAFNEAASSLSAREYHLLLENLLSNGTGYRKVSDPSPAGTRICLQVEKSFVLPVQWGEFTVSAGGALAIPEKNVPDLAQALREIRRGLATPEETLFSTDPKGKIISRFDVYGMEPGFMGQNFRPSPLEDSTREAITSIFATDLGGAMAETFVNGTPGAIVVRHFRLRKSIP